MLLGNARARDERGRNIEKTEYCLLDGKRISDAGPANRRKAGVEAFGLEGLIIREYEERPLQLL